MKLFRVLALLLCLAIAPSALDTGKPVAAAEPLFQKDFVVHEWGVLSTFPEVDLANADRRSEWDAMPKFVFGQLQGRPMPQTMDVRLINLPVIHLYAPQTLDANLRVDFLPGGKPLVWWPENINNVHDYQTGRSKLRGNFLEWQVQLKSAHAPNLAQLPVPAGHWMGALRSVKADEMVVWGTNQRLAAKEKFLYYDGTVPTPKALEITGQKDKLRIKNPAVHPAFDVTAVDRRTPDKVRVARLSKIEGGADKALEFVEMEAKDWADKAVETLAGQLKDAGLYEDEAKVVAQVWKSAFFESEGLTVFSRFPQSEYDRLLPLTVNPRPEKLARIMLVHQARSEPELAEMVQKVIQQLGAKEFAERIKAQKQLTAIGKAAIPFLARALKETTDPETRMRLEKLLEDFDIKTTVK